MFSIACLKFLDSYNFLAMPLDQMANIYGCKTKKLYPYQYFGLDSYDEVIGNLKSNEVIGNLNYVQLSIKNFKLNPLHYVNLPGYSFDCWLMSSGVALDTLPDKKMLDDFVEGKRGGICGIMRDRIVNNV